MRLLQPRTGLALLVALAMLPAAVLAASSPGPYREVRTDPYTISPDGDGKHDQSAITLTSAEFTSEQTLSIEVLDSRGNFVRTLAMDDGGDAVPTTYKAVFDGTDGQGARLKDDTYLLNVKRNGQTYATAKVVVDATPPEAQAVVINPSPFAMEVSFHARFSEHVNWLLSVQDATGRTVWTRQGAGLDLTEKWDGVAIDGTAVPDGPYTLVLHMADRGGHQRRHMDLPFQRKSQVGMREFQIDRKVMNQWQTMTISALVDEPVTYRFDLVSYEGISVRAIGGGAGPETPLKIVMDGRDSQGVPLPDGAYNWTLTLEDRFGNRSGGGRGDLRIDSKPPQVEVGPMPVVTAKDVLYVPYRAADENGVKLSVSVEPVQGTPRRLTLDASATELAIPLAPGTQNLVFSTVDSVGNEVTHSFLITRVVKPTLQVFVGRKPLQSEVPPEIVDGRTVLPLRAVAEALGFEVRWDDSTRTILLVKGARVVGMAIGNTTASVDGEVRTLEVAPFIREDRTMVPVRFISEGLGLKVTWDAETRSVLID